MRQTGLSARLARFAVFLAMFSVLNACSRGPALKADQFDFETIKKAEEEERSEARSKAKKTIQLASFTLDLNKTVQGKKLDEKLIYHELYIMDLDLRLDGKEAPSLLMIIFEQQVPAGVNCLSGGSIRLVQKRPGYCRLSGVVRVQGKGEVTLNIRDPRVEGRTLFSCPATFVDSPQPKNE